MRRMAIATLTSLGYEITAAETGDAALALVESGVRFDLVFTDIMMPGKLTGIGLARELRARGLGSKIVFTSGFASPRSLQEEVSERGEVLVRKPYRKADVAKAVRRVLDGAAPGSDAGSEGASVADAR